MFITKLSILLQIRRLFTSSTKDRFRVVIDAVIWLNALFYIADSFVEIFQCVPRSKIFNPAIPGRCVQVNNAIIVTACINISSDFLIFALPLLKIWRLQMPSRQKVGVSAVFALGFLHVLSDAALCTGDANQTVAPASLPLLVWSQASIPHTAKIYHLK